MVWHNSNQFSTLKNLYSKGLIEDKYVEIICNYYNKKYTVDFIEEEKESQNGGAAPKSQPLLALKKRCHLLYGT